MAKSPKKVPQRLTADMREAIREMSKAPFGSAGKPSKFPQLTTAEAEELKAKAQKVQPLTIKREGVKLTPEQLDKVAKRVSKEKGISFNQAKELLWEELSKSPISKDVKQPGTMLSKKIPTREQFESEGYRAVKYQGKVIYLSPAQVKQVAKDLGVPIEKSPAIPLKPSEGVRASALPEETFLTKQEQAFLTQEKIKAAGAAAEESRFRGIDKLSPEARAIQDRRAAAEAERLRSEAIRDWENQARAAQVNPEVRKPSEALNKPSPTSVKAENYANRLYEKAFQQLSKQERKAIQMIIEEEARRAQKASGSKISENMAKQNIRRGSFKPTIVPKPDFTGGGAIGGIFGAAGAVLEGVYQYKTALAELSRQKREIT